MSSQRNENSLSAANILGSSPFAAQAKTPLDGDADSSTGGVRFAPSHEVFRGNARSVASSAPASSSGVERQSFSQKIDDSIRAGAQDALESLLAGNERFRQGSFSRCIPDLELLPELVDGHCKPAAAVLCCSDARVPPELVMDQGLGDLYVIRVAGNVVNDFVLGSVMFAVEKLGVRLVMVLGHTQCTIVASAVHQWATNKQNAVLDKPTAQAVAADLQKSSVPREDSSVSQASPSASPSPAHRGKLASSSSKPGLLSRVFGHHGKSHGADTSVQEPKADVRTPSWRSSQSMDGSHRSMDRSSISPVDRIVGALTYAVDSVAAEGKSLSNFVLKLEDAEDKETLAKGLKKLDSMDYNRARMAQSKSQSGSPGLHVLRSIEAHDDVEAVIIENTIMSSKSILRGLVRQFPAELVKEVEVVPALYGLSRGEITVLKRGWYSGRSIYFE